MNKKPLFILFSVAIVGVIFLAIVFSKSQNDDSVLKIRVAGNIPLTGPAAAFSGQYPNGFRMGIEDACKQHQVNPEKFHIDFQDNAFENSKTVSILQQQQISGFDVYISGLTPQSLAVAPSISSTSKAHFIVAFDALMTEKFKDMFRILPHFKEEGPLFSKYARYRGAKRVFCIHSNFSGYNDQYSRIIEPSLKDSGMEYQTEVYDFGTKDFRTIALKIKAFNPDLIFISSLSPDLLPMIDAIRQQGMDSPGMILTTMDLIDLFYSGAELKRLQGIAFTCPKFELTVNQVLHEDWSTQYENKYGRRPNYMEAYAYDTAGILVAAYSILGGVSPQQIRSVMPYEGITGTIQLDEYNDVSGILTIATLSENNKMIEINTER